MYACNHAILIVILAIYEYAYSSYDTRTTKILRTILALKLYRANRAKLLVELSRFRVPAAWPENYKLYTLVAIVVVCCGTTTTVCVCARRG